MADSPLDILARLENPVENEPVVDAPPVDPPATEPPPVVNDPSADPVVDPPADGGELILGKFKTQDDLAKAYKEAEKKMHEESQMRRQYEEFLVGQQMQQNQAAEASKFSPIGEPQTMDELMQLTYDDPSAAVNFAMERAPHLMSKVVSTVRSFDPDEAEKINGWYQDVRLEQRLSQMQQPIHEMQAKGAALQATSEVQSLPGYEALREDIAKVVQERPHWFNVDNPQQLAAALRDAYEIAKARNPQKVQAGNDALNQQRQLVADNALGIEGGTHSGSNTTPPEADDPAKNIRDAILAQAKKMHI